MERSARWHEASLVPEHGQTPTILSPELTLQDRIRSLLLSRNEKYPPKTPTPSPDYVYLSRHPDEAAVGNLLTPPRTDTFNPAKAITRLEAFYFLSEVMGASRFDGPAGQFDEGEAVQGRRNSSSANMLSDRTSPVEERQNSSVSGVNHNTREDLVGRKLSMSDSLHRSRSSSSKRPTKSRNPQISYTLRTVAPSTHKKANGQFPTAVKSEAKSYCPEGDEKKSSVLDDHQSETKHHHGPFMSAVDALHNIQGHDTGSNSTTPSSLRQNASQGVGTSTATAFEPQDIFGSMPDTQSNTSQTTRSMGAEYEKPSARSRQSQISTPDGELNFSTMKEPRSDFAGLQLGEILADLPPVNNGSSMALSQRHIPLEADEIAETSEASLLPKNLTEKDEPNSRSSPVSRALSMLSNVSAISGFRTPRRLSAPKENRVGIENTNEDPMTFHTVPTFKSDKSHEYRHINSRKPSLSRKPPNLTMRPSQLKRAIAVTPSMQNLDLESTDDALFARGQQKTSESFHKVIVDLESLLKEALDIAGRASRDNSEVDPPPPLAKRNGYRRLSNAYSDDQSSASDDQGNEEDHVFIIEPDDEDRYHGNFSRARDATPFARSLATTRHQSTVPPLNIQDDKQGQSATSNEISQEPGPASTYHFEPLNSTDWALIKQPTWQSPEAPEIPVPLKVPSKEQHSFLIRDHGLTSEASGNTASSFKGPQIQPRVSSKRMQKRPTHVDPPKDPNAIITSDDSVSTSGPYVADFKNSALQYHPVYREAMADESSVQAVNDSEPNKNDNMVVVQPMDPQSTQQGRSHPTKDEIRKGYTLRGRHHFEIRDSHGFSLSRSHRRAPIARDWDSSRKRFVATVTCLNTALLGLIIGIYAGEVPAIQYVLADQHHVVILGNIVFFVGLAITTALFWPLPLLHGRKPYNMAALTLVLTLFFPQALAIDGFRSPYIATYRVGLLVPRAIAGFVMGFANINYYGTLLDLFGASLQSGNPHQEVADEHDVRRHGGGMGVWLGIWTWSWIGSIGIGFWIGASIISRLQVSWGFWILIILTSSSLLLNVLTPEVRRSAYRRSMAEVRSGTDISRRIARGEIKMHLYSTGPLWWWEEVWAGHVMCIRMLKQPGFAVVASYLGWIYGQVVLVIVLLGALLSKYYFFHPQFVGLSIAIIPLGALLAIPFQKASLFSRSRHHRQRTDSMTFEKRVTWTSHLVRRSIFMIVLPFAGMAYTLASRGPPTHYVVPIIFAGVIGFLSNLAIAECNGVIMETFDTSDLQPGMTGRPRNVLPEEIRKKRTNFSCFPRVTAGFAVAQTVSFCVGAAVTGWGGVIERHVGAQVATAVMAGVLLILTILLIAVLTRYKTVQIVPSQRFGTNILSGPEDEWKPVIIGHPSGTTRRVSLLELGTLSRWTEIRRRNRLSRGPDE